MKGPDQNVLPSAANQVRSPSHYEDSKSTFSRQVSASNPAGHSLSGISQLHPDPEVEGQIEAQPRQHQLDAQGQSFTQNLNDLGSMSPGNQANQELVLLGNGDRGSPKKSHQRGRNPPKAMTTAQLKQEDYDMRQMQLEMAQAQHNSKRQAQYGRGNQQNVKEKSKTKRGKGQSNRLVLQETLLHSLEAHGAPHYAAKAASSKNKGTSGQRVSIQNAFLVAAAQAQQASHGGHSPTKRRAPRPHQVSMDHHESAVTPYLQHGSFQPNGQGPGGHGRRVLVPESGAMATPVGGMPSQKTSQKVLLQKEMAADAEQQRRGSQAVGSGVASNSNSVKRSMVLQNPQSQTNYNNYNNQLNIAERQMLAPAQMKQKHRKHQPVPIDTFNIVSNRRKSLVKQVNEANASTDAMINNAYTNLSNSQQFVNGELVQTQATNQIVKKPSTQNGGNLVLPQIQSNTSKTGMVQYTSSAAAPRTDKHAHTQKTSELQTHIMGQQTAIQSQSHTNTHYQSIENNNGIIGGLAQSDNKDLKRRTTGSIFQSPNGQVANGLIHNQTIHQNQKDQAMSVHTTNHLSKRIKNIISPIQSSHNALDVMSAQQRNDILNQGSSSSPKQLRSSYNGASSNKQANGARSTKTQLAQSQIPSDAQNQIYSEQQAATENTMLFDSMVNKINPRSHGSRGPDFRNNDDSIQRHAKQIGKSGPINVTNPSRLDKQSIHSNQTKPQDYLDPNVAKGNMVTTPDYDVNPKYQSDIIAAAQQSKAKIPLHENGISGMEQLTNAIEGSMSAGYDYTPEVDRFFSHSLKNGQFNQDKRQVNGEEEPSDGDDGVSDEDEDSSEEEPSDYPQPQDLTSDPANGRIVQGAVTPQGSMIKSNFAQHVKQQLNLRQNQQAVTTAKERKKSKKHKNKNTHHHYHIDFNFEQVNNILVSYGGMGLHQQLKNQIKKDTSKANVQLSLGVVNGQFNNHQRNHSIQNPINIQNTPGSPSKRQQMQPNGVMLPELIINKNKINFGNKSNKLNNENQQMSSRQNNHNSTGPNISQYNFGIEKIKNHPGGAKSRRKKHKRGEGNSSSMIDDSNIIMAPGRKANEKYKTPKRQQISQSLNPSMISNINNSATESREPIKVLRQNQVNLQQDLRLVKGPGVTEREDLDNNMSKRQSNANSRASKDSRGKQSKSRAANNPNLNINENHTQNNSRLGNNINQSINNESELKKKNAINMSQSASRPLENAQQEQIRTSDSKINNHNSTMGNFNLKQNAIANQHPGTYTQKPPMQAMPQVGALGNSLKVRQKQHLQVITKSGNLNSQNAIDTPKKYFNVKAQQSGQKTRMAYMEHNSAGLRPHDKASGLRQSHNTRAGDHEDASPTKNMTKANFNTLSQISSKLSGENEKSIAGVKKSTNFNNNSIPHGDQEKTSNNRAMNYPSSALPHRAGGGLIQHRHKKTRDPLKDQEKGLKKIIEQFNTANREREPDEIFSAADAVNLGGSPLLPKGGKTLNPAKIEQEKMKITDFDILECIGIGNFGHVHKAINKVKNRTVALKILKKESVAAMKHVDHIVNEREVLQFLSDKNRQFTYELQQQLPEDDETRDVPECPFLMDIYSSFQDKENLYFELEYIQGCTLLSQIRQYNQTVQQGMVYYAAEVLHSLQYLHNNNIIYRDLKPENIVISMTERGHIKLVDFGFAKRLKEINQKTLTNCGTPAYIAPEILRGHNGHGYEVDVWGLGVLMVEIVSGQTPFHADTTQGIYEKVQLCQPQYNKFVTHQMRDLLSKIFVPDPELRLSLEEIKQHQVFNDFDFTVNMRDRYCNATAPFIPKEAAFNEQADRDSVEEEIKPKNILAAIMGNPMHDTNSKPAEQKKMEFNEDHYNKFQREDKKAAGDKDDGKERRRRQNPLGDFKFKRINELF